MRKGVERAKEGRGKNESRKKRANEASEGNESRERENKKEAKSAKVGERKRKQGEGKSEMSESPTVIFRAAPAHRCLLARHAA